MKKRSYLRYCCLFAACAVFLPQVLFAAPSSQTGGSLAVFDSGVFTIASELGAMQQQSCGGPGDIPLPGNYLSDIRAKRAVWNPSFGLWHVCGEALTLTRPWGAVGDVPVPADFNGDGLTDYAVFRPVTGEWFIVENSGDLASGEVKIYTLGLLGDLPVPADYDGDGSAEPAVFRRDSSSGGALWIRRESDGGEGKWAFGLIGDVPVPADYDGDGATEPAVWRPSNGSWYFLGGQGAGETQFGLSGDVPAPFDFDGDGKADLIVYRPSVGMWFLRLEKAGAAEVLTLSQGRVGARVAATSQASILDRRAVLDLNGDRLTDLAVLRPKDDGTLELFFQTGTGQTHPLASVKFGAKGDTIVSGDFDGDAISDLTAVRTLSDSIEWRFRFSSEQQNGTWERIASYGLPGDQILAANYDGDSKTDMGVVRNMPDGYKLWIPSNSTMSSIVPVSWGFATDKALTADVDGDKKSDFIVVREVNGELMWFVRTAAGAALEPRLYGFVGDRVIAGDYNADGKAEIGVIRIVNGLYMVIIDAMAPYYWGIEGDTTFAGQYGGDGRMRRVVWRVLNGQGYFFIEGENGQAVIAPFGVVGDIPLSPTGQTLTQGSSEDSSSSNSNQGGSGARLNCATTTQINQQESGFVWKPVSESDGKLAVLFGSSRAGSIKKAALVESTDEEDVVLETLRYVGNTNGGRPTFRANRPGYDYPNGVILVRQDEDNRIHCIVVPDPGSRTG